MLTTRVGMTSQRTKYGNNDEMRIHQELAGNRHCTVAFLPGPRTVLIKIKIKIFNIILFKRTETAVHSRLAFNLVVFCSIHGQRCMNSFSNLSLPFGNPSPFPLLSPPPFHTSNARMDQKIFSHFLKRYKYNVHHFNCLS